MTIRNLTIFTVAFLLLSICHAGNFTCNVCIGDSSASPSLTFGIGTEDVQTPFPPFSGQFGVNDFYLANPNNCDSDPDNDVTGDWARLGTDIRTGATTWNIVCTNANGKLYFNQADGSAAIPTLYYTFTDMESNKIVSEGVVENGFLQAQAFTNITLYTEKPVVPQPVNPIIDDTIIYAVAETDPYSGSTIYKTKEVELEAEYTAAITKSVYFSTATTTPITVYVGNTKIGTYPTGASEANGYVCTFKCEGYINASSTLSADATSGKLKLALNMSSTKQTRAVVPMLVYQATAPSQDMPNLLMDIDSVYMQIKSYTVIIKESAPIDDPPVITVTTAPGNDYAEAPYSTLSNVLTASVTAIDQKIEAEESPSGIKQFKWTLWRVIDDEQAPQQINEGTSGFTFKQTDSLQPENPTAQGQSTLTLTFGYDAINGYDRPANQTFRLRVVAFDGNGNSSTPTEFSFNLKDIDRAPAAPTITVNPPSDKTLDTLATGDTVSATLGAVTDPDGDVVTYTVQFITAYDGKETKGTVIETGEISNIQWNLASVLKKGDVVKVNAAAIGTRKADSSQMSSDTASSNEYTVTNTAPYISQLGTEEVEQPEAISYIWEGSNLHEDCEAQTMSVKASDIDADVQRDKIVSYKVSALSNPNAGKLSVDKEGTITFKPAAHYNTVDTNETLTFTVTATDESGADCSNDATVTIKVTEVNNAPILAISDIYVLYNQFGEMQQSTYAVQVSSYGDQYESNQRLQAIEIKSKVDKEDSILDYLDAQIGEDGVITVFYTIKAGTEFGCSETVVVSAQDNGTTDGISAPLSSGEYELTIHVGEGIPPWYPLITFTSDSNYDGYAVVLTENVSKDSQTFIIRDGRTDKTLWPADYVNNGFKGYMSDTELTIKVYPYSVNGGIDTDTLLYTKDNETISNYGVPCNFVANGEAVVDNSTGWVQLPSISMSMARSYTMNVYRDSKTTPVYTITSDFLPEGKVIRSIIPASELQLSEKGVHTYSVKVIGYNPSYEKETEEYEVLTFEMNMEQDVEIDFAEIAEDTWENADAVFMPANGNTLDNGEDVSFVWPAVPGAIAYTLHVTDFQGEVLCNKTITGTNTYALTLTQGQITTPESFNWYVTAISQNDESYRSSTKSVSVFQMTEMPIVTKMTVSDDGTYLILSYQGVVDDSIQDSIYFNCTYFNKQTLKKYTFDNVHAIYNSTTKELTMVLPCTLNVGDFVMADCIINGQYVDKERKTYRLR